MSIIKLGSVNFQVIPLAEVYLSRLFRTGIPPAKRTFPGYSSSESIYFKVSPSPGLK